jgi:signal-transduction protein with cAMP-binding, CBS, and nucleotidyltransferase domain
MELASPKLLAETAGVHQTGIGWFGGFRAERGRIDLKKAGCSIVTRHERAAPARLQAHQGFQVEATQNLDGLLEAQGLFLDFILRLQIQGVTPRLQPTTPS